MKINKTQFINDIKAGDAVDSFFIISEKQVKKKKNGEDYCTVLLQDREGTVEGIIWTEVFLKAGSFLEGDLVEIKGVVREYKGKKQIVINVIKKIEKDGCGDLSDFIKTTDKNIDRMFEEMSVFIDSVENSHLKELLNSFISDKDFVEGFKSSTAAVRYHHAYKGGLLEHTLNVVKICSMLAGIYDNLNRDLLIAGAMLHDIGKIKEYSSGIILKATNRGRLLGHIAIGYGWVREKIRHISGFPEELSDRLLHLILSHHGYYEFGSPRRPKILEAFVLYHVDHLDGDIGGFNAVLENTSDDSEWSDYARNFDRRVFVKKLDIGEERNNKKPDENNKGRRKEKESSDKDSGQAGLF
jgi:3'-5' exoribonuclease